MSSRPGAPSPLFAALVVLLGGLSLGMSLNSAWLILLGLAGPVAVLVIYLASTLFGSRWRC